ncbi:MAG TPA: acetyl-CoA hydrolase/transferase C-terminal domain-containing protein [Anaerolineales bacterium]|nr:acetyl-CoA hydrolase/transferase C-terminal domain-containing protein [Anaerolineales bacterium]
MNWNDLYNQRVTSAEVAVKQINSGMRVFLSGNCSVPQTVLAALVARAHDLQDVEIIQVLSIGGADYVSPDMAGHLRINTLFISDNVREAVNDGRADFTPAHLSEIPRLFSSGVLPIDVALIQVSPPDEHGYCSFGVEVGVTKTAAQYARIVIAEVNPQMPRTLGDSFIHVSKIHQIVPVHYPLPEVSMGEPTEVSKKIGSHVAGLIEDGSTLQMGIGAIPGGVLLHLRDKRHLGIHTELFSDGVIELYEAGVITNEKKTLHPGKMIAGFLLGTRRLYDFVDNNPVVELHPTEYVNDSYIIAQNERMVAINSAIEVDLTGQVCADSIGTRLYSGTGGQLDFIRGAARSKGGKPIIALPSITVTGSGKRFSRIVPTLKPGAGVVTTRNDVRYIVTEYGVADLYGKSLRQRARALIDIAHPEMQEELEYEASKLKYIFERTAVK